MTLDELKEIIEDFAPDYRISFDKNRQIVIYTGLGEAHNGELIDVDELTDYEDTDGGDNEEYQEFDPEDL